MYCVSFLCNDYHCKQDMLETTVNTLSIRVMAVHATVANVSATVPATAASVQLGSMRLRYY